MPRYRLCASVITLAALCCLTGTLLADYNAIACPKNAGDGNFVAGQQWQHVMEGAPTIGDTSLKIGNSNYSSGPHRSLLRFDLSDLDPCCTIHRATLRMDNANHWDTDTMDLRVCAITEPWGSLVNWNTQPAFDAVNDYQANWYYGTFGYYYDAAVDVTDLVAQWLNATLPNYGMILRSYDDTSYQDSPGGWSIMNGTAPTRPVLDIAATDPTYDQTYAALGVTANVCTSTADPCMPQQGPLKMLYAGPGSGTTHRSYLRFDGIDIPEGHYVKTAVLHLKGIVDNAPSGTGTLSVYACTGNDDWTERPGSDNPLTAFNQDSVAPMAAAPSGSVTWVNGDTFDHWSEDIILNDAALAQACVDNGKLTLALLVENPADTAHYMIWPWQAYEAQRVEIFNAFGHYGAWLEVITSLPETCGDAQHPDPGAADINDDCVVDMADLAELAGGWLE